MTMKEAELTESMPVRNRAMTRLTASSVDTRGSDMSASSTQTASSVFTAPLNGQAPCVCDVIIRVIVRRDRRCAASTYLPIILQHYANNSLA